jgi:hypothetical protein
LHVDVPLATVARENGIEEAQLEALIQAGRKRLLEARQQRQTPERDEKILLAWNSLMISAMARAYQVLEEQDFLESARQAAEFILDQMVLDDRLRHSYKDGQAPLEAYQDDYACFINALLDLYEADFDPRWLEAAQLWNQRMLDEFWDTQQGGFFYTAQSAETLILRTKNPLDNATPSGNSIATLGMLRLAALTGKADWAQKADQVLQSFSGYMQRAPGATIQMVNALDFQYQRPTEIAVIGSVEQRLPFLRALHERFLPNKIVVAAAPEQGARANFDIPLLEGKIGSEGMPPRAYVCRNLVCAAPVVQVEDFVGLLDKNI